MGRGQVRSAVQTTAGGDKNTHTRMTRTLKIELAVLSTPTITAMLPHWNFCTRDGTRVGHASGKSVREMMFTASESCSWMLGGEEHMRSTSPFLIAARSVAFSRTYIKDRGKVSKESSHE